MIDKWRAYFENQRDGSVLVVTPGLDMGGRATVIHRNGQYQVWRKSAGSCWNGKGCGHRYVPVSLILVRYDGAFAHWIKEIQPGRDKTILPELKRLCDDYAYPGT